MIILYQNISDLLICKIHGIFNQTADSHLRGSGCPKCFQFSKGEEIIERFLINNNIKFEYQKSFEDCINVNKLKFDFYVPSYNLCIEFDGKQHYKKVEFYGGEDGLKSQIKRDEIKNIYCMKNNIGLLRLKYTQLKKINKILYDKFNTKTERQIPPGVVHPKE